jgi:predicted nucleic acid-binding protein
MRAALDTNLLVVAEGFGDQQRVSATRALLEQLSDADLVVPLQCLGELFRVLTGKAGRSANQAQDAVLGCCSQKISMPASAGGVCGS